MKFYSQLQFSKICTIFFDVLFIPETNDEIFLVRGLYKIILNNNLELIDLSFQNTKDQKSG